MSLLSCVHVCSAQLFTSAPSHSATWFSKCGSWTSSGSFTRELVRNANFQAPPQIYRKLGQQGPAICFTSSPGDPGAQRSLRTTDIAEKAQIPTPQFLTGCRFDPYLIWFQGTRLSWLWFLPCAHAVLGFMLVFLLALFLLLSLSILCISNHIFQGWIFHHNRYFKSFYITGLSTIIKFSRNLWSPTWTPD